MDRAFHCRIAGLVRWEAGRTDEGAALLDRAVLYYAAEELVEEQGATLALAGLLEEEEGQSAPGLAIGRSGPDPRWREAAERPRAELRRVYRLGGQRIKPLPFA